MRFTKPLTARTGNTDLDRLLANYAQAISELQRQPGVNAKLISGVELPNDVDIPVGHGLGRPARVFWSPPQDSTSAGRIRERRLKEYDPAHYFVVRANGYGATVTVDFFAVPV